MVLTIENVNLWYKTQHVLNQVNFSLEKGRILALIGPNGAGKSSTMRVLAGLVKPQSGNASMAGKPLEFKDLRKYFGFFIESPSFYPYLSGLQNLKLLTNMQPDAQRPTDLLAQVGLAEAANKPFSQYSKGMKQRLGIAQTLIGNPDFLVLDEPFNGLDPEVKENLMHLVVDLAKNHGKGILITSHLLADLEELADDFVLLNRGSVHLQGKISDYINERQRVTMHFLNDISALSLPETAAIINRQPHELMINATAAETRELLLALAQNNFAPYSVVRSDLLHEKYMEITA